MPTSPIPPFFVEGKASAAAVPGAHTAKMVFNDVNLAEPSSGGSSDDDYLKIPPLEHRPSSAPAGGQHPEQGTEPAGAQAVDPCRLLSALAGRDAPPEPAPAQGQPGAVGALLVPSSSGGALDFNFESSPVDDTKDDYGPFVSVNLEQDLRRDAETRGRSLSPKRSNAFDLVGFPGERIAAVCDDDIHKRSPTSGACGSATPPDSMGLGSLAPGPASGTARKEEDLSKLRMQQEILANQLRSLQEQEWAILERRPSHDSGPSLSHSAGITPASTRSLLSTPPRGEGSATRRGPAAGAPHSDLFSNSTPPSSFTTPQSVPMPFPHLSQTTPPRDPQGRNAPPSSVLLTPHMLDLKSAPPGHRLDTFYGHIGMVAKDQHGCRFLQKLCEDGNQREIGLIFDEIAPLTGDMMVDPFGNYLMQKLCEHCNEAQRTVLITKVAAEVPHVASEMHGTRAVQKMVEQLHTPEQVSIMRTALSQHTVQMVKDLNGNHVIQKCLQKFEEADKQFIYDAVSLQLCDVAMHRHGCCVLQRCIDFGSSRQKMQLVAEVVKHALLLVQDPFGNYVVQYVLDMHVEHVTLSVIQNFSGSLCELAMNKFSSNVIEKCIKLASEQVKAIILAEMCDEHVLPRMLQDPFANYVVQTALNSATPEEFAMLTQAIRPYLHTIKNTPHGKKIEMKLNRKADGDRGDRGKGRSGRGGGRQGKGDRQHNMHADRGGYNNRAAMQGGSGGGQWGQWGAQGGGGGGGGTGWGGSAYDQPQDGAAQRGGRAPHRSGGGGFGALRPDAPAYHPQRTIPPTATPPTAAHW
eukprot:TRINITY_DN1005_c0_g1_i1.p1 TRINITY_DN1005_c0_g1~~TRINITY_DN1005_c0_g1_i1.p1  ORF type:complete len:803 (+),score=194.47 TRINITY_DN1005_c0_g1_i1:270-2678(+)